MTVLFHRHRRALAVLPTFAALPACSTLQLCAQTPQQVEFVRPSAANPAVRQFDDENVVIRPQSGIGTAPLAVFLPGTGGKPRFALRISKVIAGQGYPTIGLEYNDTPAGVFLCPRNPNPACFFHFRAVRSFAQGVGPVANTYPESIEGRLADLLRYLDAKHPGEGWANYLNASGRPEWSRIVVSGLSQGAGMAAFIAKERPVYRVVLFSSPWDFTGPDRHPAPWLFRNSATPMDRWWAERHERENTTGLIAAAYQALQIPQAHMLVFRADLPAGAVPTGENPFHPSTITNPVYEPQWKTMFGSPSQP